MDSKGWLSRFFTGTMRRGSSAASWIEGDHGQKFSGQKGILHADQAVIGLLRSQGIQAAIPEDGFIHEDEVEMESRNGLDMETPVAPFAVQLPGVFR